MNSLNILSARVSPPQTPAPSRSNSYGSALSLAGTTDSRKNSKGNLLGEKEDISEEPAEEATLDDRFEDDPDEKAPLLGNAEILSPKSKPSGWYLIPHRIASTLINSLRWVVTTLVAPGVYLIACLYNEEGRFAPIYQFRKLWTGRTMSAGQGASGNRRTGNGNAKDLGRRASARSGRKFPLSSSSSSGLSSESESERDQAGSNDGQQDTAPSRHSRSKSLQSSDEISPARRSIRIKLHNEDSLRQRKHRKTQSTSSQSNGSGAVSTSEISPATLKSPTSPAASLLLTKYPRAPAPPRPLIPRRLPSYTHMDQSNGRMGMKTLILDLDETLIHSMAKGGRMGTGHMVEVKLNTHVGVAGQASIGPQHPILYYVHKRPFCDEFLRRVSSYSYCEYGIIDLSFSSGLQVVQSCHIYSVGSGVRGSSHRLVRTRTKVFFRTLLPSTLHIS
jgi:CTD nuclear envelope phosphatase 1